VEIERFEPELHALFDDFPSSEHPREKRFDHVLERVPGLARENNLALLNLAASLLGPGESYVELGSYRGTSLIAAMLDNEGKEFVGIDNFKMGDGSRKQLERNLASFDLEGATILEGDAFTLVPNGALGERRVGVYYYDGPHSYEAHLQGLVMIEPYLASRALLVVDDSDWEQVADATRDYLAQQPQARMLVWIPGKDNGLPSWWEGVQVLAWETEEEAGAQQAEAVAVAELVETA
jgi:predicted O-methyltransferase YrrM